MKSKYTRINFIVIIVFIISMIYTTLQLFTLQDELILGVSTLSTDDVWELSTVLNTVYITVALSLIAGLIAILLNYETGSQVANQLQATYSPHKENKKTAEATSEQNTDITDFNMNSIQNAIKTNSEKKEKYTAVLTEICNKVGAGQGAIYLVKESKENSTVELYASYAFHSSQTEALSFSFGEGLIGQVAEEGSTLIIDDVPENYISIASGLGSASPKHLLIAPIVKSKKNIGVIELASFTAFSKEEEAWIREGMSLLVTTPDKKVATDKTPVRKKVKGKNE